MTATTFLGAVLIVAVTLWIWKVWPRNQPRWSERQDIRAALRNLDIRNGWIVERGRQKGFAVLHCGTCPNNVRVFDYSSNGEAMDLLIEHITGKRCAHEQEAH